MNTVSSGALVASLAFIYFSLRQRRTLDFIISVIPPKSFGHDISHQGDRERKAVDLSIN